MARAMNNGHGVQRSTWQRRVAWWFGGAVVVVVLWLIGAAVIPRWWAHRVTDVTEGRLVVGGLFGAFIGFVFTLVPLLVVWAAFRTSRGHRSWKGWLAWLLVAAVLALPNLMTLGIVWGGGDAAHDGRAELDTDGNGFRMWSLIGAIAGGLAILALVYLVRTRGWFRDESRRLRQGAEPAAGPKLP